MRRSISSVSSILFAVLCGAVLVVSALAQHVPARGHGQLHTNDAALHGHGELNDPDAPKFHLKSREGDGDEESDHHDHDHDFGMHRDHEHDDDFVHGKMDEHEIGLDVGVGDDLNTHVAEGQHEGLDTHQDLMRHSENDALAATHLNSFTGDVAVGGHAGHSVPGIGYLPGGEMLHMLGLSAADGDVNAVEVVTDMKTNAKQGTTSRIENRSSGGGFMGLSNTLTSENHLGEMYGEGHGRVHEDIHHDHNHVDMHDDHDHDHDHHLHHGEGHEHHHHHHSKDDSGSE